MRPLRKASHATQVHKTPVCLRAPACHNAPLVAVSLPPSRRLERAFPGEHDPKQHNIPREQGYTPGVSPRTAPASTFVYCFRNAAYPAGVSRKTPHCVLPGRLAVLANLCEKSHVFIGVSGICAGGQSLRQSRHTFWQSRPTPTHAGGNDSMAWLRLLGWISLGVVLGVLAGTVAREWTDRPATPGLAPSSWTADPTWSKTVPR